MSATILLKTDSKTPNRDQLFAAYKYVVNNWAVSADEVAEGLGCSVSHARMLLKALDGGLVVADHVNGERALTYQSYFDIENEAGVPAKSTRAFNKVFPKGVEVEFTAPKATGRKGATGPRYTPEQIKKGLAAKKAGKNNREVAEAAGVKSPAYFSKVLKAAAKEAEKAAKKGARRTAEAVQAGSKPRRTVRRSTKAAA